MINRIISKFQFLLLKRNVVSFEQLRRKQTFKNFDEKIISQSKKFLKPFYDQYVREISRPDMATSLELAATLYSICKVNQFSKLLDLGSGFSSFVFRKHSKLNANVIVYSVDDDTRWLGKTREYLIDSSVSADNLMTLSEFIDSNENQFDIVLLDLNFVEVRKNYIKLVIDRCKIGGLIFFDDVHKQEFMTEVLSQASNLPVDIFDVKNCTLDEFGRFAVVAIKKK